jgi:BRCA1-associated protein
MPSYFYHLKLELYSHPATSTTPPERSRTSDIVVPPPHADIFATFTDPESRRHNVYAHRTAGAEKLPVRLSNKEAAKDWRYDSVLIQSIDMGPQDAERANLVLGKSIEQGTATRATGGLATKGKYVPLNPKSTEVGWGIVHLYRDGEETPGLYDEVKPVYEEQISDAAAFDDDTCTTLCILAVPSYMTPSDLLGFLGEQTREDVSHFRLIRSGKSNKYMVLMKFREADNARRWRKEWNGKLFNSMDVSCSPFSFVTCWTAC